MTRRQMLGCVADDFTGASDAASFLQKAGMRTLLLNEVQEKITALEQIDAVVIVSDGELRETQMTNYFSNLYPIDCAVLSVNAQSYRKYGTLPEHEFLPEI